MNNIVERLRFDGHDAEEDLAVMAEAADLIEQQAARIKELEAELGAGHLQCIADRQKYKQQLAILRKRIDDAPVVAEVGSVQGQTSFVFQTSDRVLKVGTKLINQEDLK